MSSPYAMTLDLNVLKHLGINLYSNVAAVLTETVANSWDADAEQVSIDIDMDQNSIIIEDDGIGMSISDMNNKYLKVGYCRRELADQKVTKKGRLVMGRKGLGKLSLFSIANIVEVQSKQDDIEKHGCRMSISDMERAVKGKNSSYVPQELSKEEITKETKGTKIILKDLKKGRLTATIASLKTRLARRFSIIGQTDNQTFNVLINKEKITIQDREDFKVVDFIWTFGPSSFKTEHFKSIKELNNRNESWDKNWNIKGWIGTAPTPKKLDSEAGNLNGIVVLARGRLFHENILEKINDGRLYTKYLTGQIEADFLDSDNLEDIATSDRQRIKEDDDRYQKLIQFLRTQLNLIESQWNELRREHEVKNLLDQSQGIKDWLSSLTPGSKKSAKKMLASLSSLPIENSEDKKNLYRHGILAFERMRLREETNTLAEGICDVNNLLQLLADRDALEGSLYNDIVKSRLEGIESFMNLVDNNKKEKVLQTYLFKHLWLLDPSWERATNTEIMEKRLYDSGIKVENLTEKEKLGRVDIAYRCISNKDVIIELKRADRAMDGSELYRQGRKYVNALKKIVKQTENRDAHIEVIFVLGKPIKDEESSESIRLLMSSISPGSRVVFYDELIQHAQKVYSEYYDRMKKIDKLEDYLKNI